MTTSATQQGVPELTASQLQARSVAEGGDIASGELAAGLSALPTAPAALEDTPPAPKLPKLSPREQRAAEVEKAQRGQRDEQLAQFRKENGLPAAENALNSEDLPPVPAKKIAAFEGDEILNLTVDGQPVEITVQQALQELQKGKTADRRLEQAVLRGREVDARAQQLAAREQQLTAAPVVDDAEQTREALKQAVSMIADGQDEDAVDLLFGVISKARAPVAAPVNVTDVVDHQIALRSMQTAEEQLRNSGKYSDIFGDEKAYGMAVAEVRRLRADSPELQGAELMTAAMQNVRDWRFAPVKDMLPDPRMERKERSAPVVRNTNVAAPATPAQRNEEKSPAAQRGSVFQNMRQARGQ